MSTVAADLWQDLADADGSLPSKDPWGWTTSDNALAVLGPATSMWHICLSRSWSPSADVFKAGVGLGCSMHHDSGRHERSTQQTPPEALLPVLVLSCLRVSECVARGKSSHNEAILRRPSVSAGEDTLEVPKFGAGYSVRARLFIPVRDLTMSRLYARKRVDHRVPSRDSDLFR